MTTAARDDRSHHPTPTPPRSHLPCGMAASQVMDGTHDLAVQFFTKFANKKVGVQDSQ